MKNCLQKGSTWAVGFERRGQTAEPGGGPSHRGSPAREDTCASLQARGMVAFPVSTLPQAFASKQACEKAAFSVGFSLGNWAQRLLETCHISVKMSGNVEVSFPQADVTQSLTRPAIACGNQALGAPSARGGGSFARQHGPSSLSSPTHLLTNRGMVKGPGRSQDFALLSPRADSCLLQVTLWIRKSWLWHGNGLLFVKTSGFPLPVSIYVLGQTALCFPGYHSQLQKESFPKYWFVSIDTGCGGSQP